MFAIYGLFVDILGPFLLMVVLKAVEALQPLLVLHILPHPESLNSLYGGSVLCLRSEHPRHPLNRVLPCYFYYTGVLRLSSHSFSQLSGFFPVTP